jgi:hypothetical protein
MAGSSTGFLGASRKEFGITLKWLSMYEKKKIVMRLFISILYFYSLFAVLTEKSVEFLVFT